MSKTIPLTQGYVAIVDDADYEELMQRKWYATRMGGGVKAACWRNGRHLYMHRVIMKAKEGEYVDHANHDTLDNRRRSNLRTCTNAQNQANRRKLSGCSSQFKGVYWSKHAGKWLARITTNYRMLHLGYFDDEVLAARSYNAAAIEHFGEFALLNEV